MGSDKNIKAQSRKWIVLLSNLDILRYCRILHVAYMLASVLVAVVLMRRVLIIPPVMIAFAGVISNSLGFISVPHWINDIHRSGCSITPFVVWHAIVQVCIIVNLQIKIKMKQLKTKILKNTNWTTQNINKTKLANCQTMQHSNKYSCTQKTHKSKIQRQYNNTCTQ